MYENTSNSIDWKGIFLKVIIAFLVVLIAVTGYKTLKGKNDTKNTETTKIAESKETSTFTENIEKLKEAGEKYYNKNKEKLPTTTNGTSMVTLNELITDGYLTTIVDEEGKTCDGESSYVVAMKEANKTKIKANLVCGETSSYSVVYLGENDSQIDKTTNSYSNTVNKTYTNTSSTSTKKNNNTSTCNTSDCTSPVNVSTNTKVEQNISIKTDSETPKKQTVNKPTNNNYKENNKRTYTVSFDKNGGTTYFRTQEVEEYDTAYNPGDNYKSGYDFIGWYLNGEEFDFRTPITRNITLKAQYRKRNYNSINNDEYEYEYEGTDTHVSSVYTMGWNINTADSVKISHTLRVPEFLENKNISEIRIAKIEYDRPIQSSLQIRTYENKHSETFFYRANGWESDIISTTSLAKINEKAVSFDYSRYYKTYSDALRNGFDVTWYASDIARQCSNPISVNGVQNVCNYGIIYKVTWEYIYR